MGGGFVYSDTAPTIDPSNLPRYIYHLSSTPDLVEESGPLALDSYLNVASLNSKNLRDWFLLGGYLGSPQGVYVEDLIKFLYEIKADAVAKDVETVVRDIQSFFPSFPKDNYFDKALAALPKEKAEKHQRLEEECTRRLWEYETVLPLLYEYLSSSNQSMP